MKSSPYSNQVTTIYTIFAGLILTLMCLIMTGPIDAQQSVSTQRANSPATSQPTTQAAPTTAPDTLETSLEITQPLLIITAITFAISLGIILALIFTGWFKPDRWKLLTNRGPYFAYYDAPVMILMLLGIIVLGFIHQYSLADPATPAPTTQTGQPAFTLIQQIIGLLQLGMMFYAAIRIGMALFNSWASISPDERPMFVDLADRFGFGLGSDPNATIIYSILGIPICIVLALASSNITAISLLVLDIHPPVIAHPTLELLRNDPKVLMQIILTAVIIMPVLEEIIFRGFLQSALCKFGMAQQRWLAILITAVIFSLIHVAASVNFVAFVPLFVLGLCWGAAYERTGSLVPPILMHVAFNGFNVMMVKLQLDQL